MGYFDKKNKNAVKDSSLTGLVDQRKRNKTPEELSNCIEYDYAFKVEFKSLEDSEKEIQDISEGFTGLRIQSRFDVAKFPEVIMECLVSDMDLKYLQDNYRKTILYITVLRYHREKVKNEIEGKEEIWNRKEFRIVEVSNGNLPNDFNNTDPEVENKITNMVNVRLSLIEKDTLEVMQKIGSYTFNKCTLADVMAFLAGRIGKEKLISIQKPDNTDEYEQIYIPPVDTFTAFNYLDIAYGIYTHGCTTFCDLGELLILNKIKPEIDKNSDITEVDIILFQSEFEARPGTNGVTYLNEKDKKVEIYYGGIPESKIADIPNKILFGKDITISNRDSFFSLEGGAGVESDDIFDRQSYFWINTSSKFAKEYMERIVSEKSEVLRMRIPFTLYEYFNPKYLINIRAINDVSQDYKGTYRVSRVNTTFLKMNSDVEIRQEDSNTSNKVLNGYATAEFSDIELLKIK